MGNLTAHSGAATPPTINDASRMVLDIRGITDTPALIDHVTQIIRLVGGDVFVFHTRTKNTRGALSYHYLIGCPPAFCQEYNARKWREIDPVLAYANHHMRPAVSTHFRSLSAGQKELMKAAKIAGFGAHIGIPVRNPGESRMGVLNVGAFDNVAEPRLYNGQGLLVHLASELLEWVACRIRQAELGEVEIQLDRLDLAIMRYCYQGFTAEQVADLCTVPLTRVRQRMRRHNEKFNSANHKIAVSRAIEMGLLRVHECTNDNTPSQLASH